MRPIERIDNFLQKVDWDKLALRWGIDRVEIGKVAFSEYDWKQYWKENPDQRIGQVLINLDLISEPYDDKRDNRTCNIWLDEECEILEAQGLPPEEYLFWTSYYDKDKNLLDTPITRLVDNLDTDHIITLIDLFYTKLTPAYKQAFANVLIKRNVHEVLKELSEMPNTLAEG